jgi:hypothetical protein
MLSPAQLAKLTALQNRGTAYEAIVTAPDGRKALLAYCSRHSFQGLCAALGRRGQSVCDWLQAGPDADATPDRKARTIAITGGGMVSWSGRTEREAIQQGELVYIGRA